MTSSFNPLLGRLFLSAWGLSCIPEHRAFVRALEDPAQAQAQVLARLLANGETCAFAKSHGVKAGMRAADFQSAVPVTDADALAPWITRIRHGEAQVLTGEPVTRLVPTSGSTGPCKLVPYTRGLLQEFQRALQAWMGDLLAQHPTLKRGPLYFATSPAQEPPTLASRIPIGYADDGEYLGPLVGALAARAMAVSPQVSHLRGEAWRQATRQALLDSQNLRLLSLWHPSYLDGVLEGETPHWPDLKVISCWADGPARAGAEALAARFPQAVLQPKGLILTEGAVSIPFGGAHPLAVRSHFLEFEETGGAVRPAHELEPGGRYRPILTTGGGLWRARLGDLIEVEGRLHETPSIRFIGRADGVCDLRGEKLSDAQVGSALASLSGFAMLAPEGDGYALYAEATLDEAQVKGVGRALCENPHYAWAIQLGQLRALRFVRVPAHAPARVLARDRAEGKVQSKPRHLDPRSGWAEWLCTNQGGTP